MTMNTKIIFWLAMANEKGLIGHSIDFNASEPEYEGTLALLRVAANTQDVFEIKGQNGLTAINMRYVTHYVVERTPTES